MYCSVVFDVTSRLLVINISSSVTNSADSILTIFFLKVKAVGTVHREYGAVLQMPAELNWSEPPIQNSLSRFRNRVSHFSDALFTIILHYFLFHRRSKTSGFSRYLRLATYEMWCWSGGREILKKILSLCYTIVYYYNGAQMYEQFLQVGQLYWALI